jgi:hypothetical protein
VTSYAEIDVDDWVVLSIEPMGSKPDKVWLEAPSASTCEDGRWLFKPTTVQHEKGRRFLKGDDWAEKIAAEVARDLAITAAPVELASRLGTPGILSRDVSGGRELVLGNEVLYGQDPDYDLHRRRGVPGYTVEAVLEALQALGTIAPDDSQGDACPVFCSYLLLDALVANTDRHHENWGILKSGRQGAPLLASTFDHASCLGFQLSDEERNERLRTRDRNRTVAAYARRGRSRHFAGSPTLVGLAVHALGRCTPSARERYASSLEALDEARLEAIVAGVPEARMSQQARIFSVRLMAENRRRLLDGLDLAH